MTASAAPESAEVARPPWRLFVALAALPVLDAVFRIGRLHPDEVFQFLDPAMNRAFGFGVLAWEWQVGLRNWAVPGLFSWLLRACAALGVEDVQARRLVLALPQFALHVALLHSVWRLTARRVGAAVAPIAVALVGLSPLVVVFAGRTLSESISAAFLVVGLERLDARAADADGRVAFAGGLLLGLAEVTRYGSAAVIAPALLWLAITRRFRALAFTIAGGAVIALGLGLFDRLTWGAVLPAARWGGWWHSLQEYVDYNLLSGKAEQFGVSPWHYYLPRLLAPVGLAGVLLWRWLPATRALLFVVPALVYVASVSVTPHKEDRFLYPALVLLTVAGAPAVAQVLARALGRAVTVPAAWMGRAPGQALVAAVVVASLPPAVPAHLWPELLQGFRPQRAEQFRLVARASREATGLVLLPEGLWGSPGSFWMNGSNLMFRGSERAPTSTRVWCTCDFPEDPCFQFAAGNAVINRGILMLPLDPERLSRSQAAFERAGFALADRDGDGLYFVRR
jgi:phosphatidylinositol glycan class B